MDDGFITGWIILDASNTYSRKAPSRAGGRRGSLFWTSIPSPCFSQSHTCCQFARLENENEKNLRTTQPLLTNSTHPSEICFESPSSQGIATDTELEAADKLLRPAATALRSGEDALLGEEELWYRRMTTEGWAWWSSFGCPTLCDPIDGSPPGSLVPGILQARTLEWVAISFSNAWKWKVKVKSLSHVRPSATRKP